MKKVYILAVATILCASASAADHVKRSVAPAPVRAQVETEKALVYEGVAFEADHSASAVKAPKKAQPVTGEAFYKRPAGSFYGGLTSNSYRYYNPYVTVKPYATTTFVASELDSYQWSVQLWDTSAGARQWYTGDTQEVGVTYAYETDSVPSVTDGVTEFHIGGTTSSGDAGWSYVAGIPDLKEWTNDETTGYALFSPKFFGLRDGNSYTSTTYTGALDADGGNTGYWFGKNYSGWNAMGLYVEKPENPYLLRSVDIQYRYLDLAADGVLKVDVYKVATRVEEDSENYQDITLGDLIASGTYTLVYGEAEESDIVTVTFSVEEDGLVYEVTPSIEDEIIVIVSGYDGDSFNKFTMNVAYDSWDEGHGQHGYMIGQYSDGTYSRCIGLDHFFNGASWESTAPSVYLDIVNPFMVLNWSMEEGLRTFDVNGNCTNGTYTGVSSYTLAANQISIYSYNSGEEFTFTLEDGSDLPTWLTIEAADTQDDNGDFSGEVVLTISCAVNEGESREAVVKTAIPGAYIYITVQQEGTSGIESIFDDGNRSVSSVQYYNLQGARLDQPQDGLNIVVTRYTDGSTSTSKVLGN